MDPIQYAVAYDAKYRSVLMQREQLLNINLSVLAKCLKFDNKDLTSEQIRCIQHEFERIKKYFLDFTILIHAKNNLLKSQAKYTLKSIFFSLLIMDKRRLFERVRHFLYLDKVKV